jgi:hypothetical protein
MQPQIGQVLVLLDARRQPLGRLTVDHLEGNLLAGRFEPEAAFSAVEYHFRAFEEAVNMQAFAKLDEIDRSISALGLQVEPAGASQTWPVTDVQLWSDGNFSCRVGAPGANALNGTPAVQQLPTASR